MNDKCEGSRFGTRWKMLIAAALGISVAGLSISITTKIDVEVEITPKEAREGWAGPAEVKKAEPIVRGMPDFQILGAPPGEDNHDKNVRLWEFALEVNGGKHLPNPAQQIGDCVAQGSARAINYLSCVQISQRKAFEPPQEYHPAFPPYIYGISRVQIGKGRIHGDGSVGAWAAEGVRVYGVLSADVENVPAYSGRVAEAWGKRGPPEEFIEIARQHPVKTVSPVRSAEEVRDAICNGYPVTIASNWGGRMKPKIVDGRLVNERRGTWNHQMCIIGYDGQTGREPYYYVLNSWGEKAHGAPPDGSPPGGFWIREKDVEYIVRQGDSFAYSNFEGFPSQELDFRIIGNHHTAVRQEGNVMHAGITLFVLALAVGVIFAYGAIRAVVLKWLRPSLIAIALLPIAAHGEEPLNFQIIGELPQAKQSRATLQPLNFTIIGETPCDQPADLKAVDHRPFVFAYKDFNIICPGCVRLDGMEDELPFRLEWKQAPAWVRSYPTLHWQGSDGRWYQYRWGMRDDDLAEFSRVWRATQGPEAAVAGPSRRSGGGA